VRENGYKSFRRKSFGQQTDCLLTPMGKSIVTRLGKHLAFGLFSKGPDKYVWKKYLTKGDILANFIFIIYLFVFYLNRQFQKWFDVDVLGFQIELLMNKFCHFGLLDCFGYFFQQFGHFLNGW
jgi:hypothetical protein